MAPVTNVRTQPNRRVRGVLVIVSASLLLAAGCGSTSDEPAATSPTSAPVVERSAGCDRPSGEVVVPSEHADVAVESSGVDRTYKRYVPGAYDGTPTAVVVDLHGYLSGAAGQAAISGLGAFAEDEGFVVATPQGTSDLPFWNAVPHEDLPDDVQFVSDVIDDVSSSLCVDPARVYVDGFSNGAFLASRVACDLSDKVAAVAAVAGLVFPEGCAPSRPMPVLAIHGTADLLVTFDGSPNLGLETLDWNEQSTRAFDGLAFAPVTTSLAAWAEVAGCDATPTDTEVSATVTRTVYDGCDGGADVELYLVEGGGHAWPGSELSKASEAILGPTTFDIVANEVIWQFFTDHPMVSGK